MLLDSTYEPLIIEVSDRTPGVKQKALLKETRITELTTEMQVFLDLQALPFVANPDGSYGEPLQEKGISPYPVPLTGNNSCAVDPTTGEPRYLLLTPLAYKNLLTGEISLLAQGQSFADFLQGLPDTYQLQGDWFYDLLKKLVRGLQTQFIVAADQPPFSKFTVSKTVDIVPMPDIPANGSLDPALAQQMAAETDPNFAQPNSPAGPTTQPATT
jgi:hypothetical protein